MSISGSAKVVVRKARTFFDRGYTWIDVYEHRNLLTQINLSYQERLFFAQVRPYLSGSDLTVYDIGAHTGIFSLMASKLVSVNTVYAFEPLPSVFPVLEQRTRHHSKISCFDVALGDAPAIASMHESSSTASSSLLTMSTVHKVEYPNTASTARDVSVSVVTLDGYVEAQRLRPPDFIKIDVQGFEDRVVKGGRNAFKSARFCMLELSFENLYHGSLLFEEMCGFMKSEGFSLVSIVAIATGLSGVTLQADGLFARDC
jgi:FkbM family methyltransferase